MQVKHLLLIGLISFGAFHAWQGREVNYGPGVIAPSKPVQEDLGLPKAFNYKTYNITPLANFTVEARVLSTEEYRFDAGADLVPIDIAMGWGRMSDESVLKDIEISQSGRFYYWRTAQFPIPREEIETHSANMHMIPSDVFIANDLKQVRKGQVIKITGYLVQAEKADGWHWRSSLTRNDTGNGACELVFVKSIRIVKG